MWVKSCGARVRARDQILDRDRPALQQNPASLVGELLDHRSGRRRPHFGKAVLDHERHRILVARITQAQLLRARAERIAQRRAHNPGGDRVRIGHADLMDSRVGQGFERRVTAHQEARLVFGVALGYRDQSVVGLVDGANRVMRRMHIGEVITGRLQILAHLHVVVHRLDPHRTPQQLRQVVADFLVPLANLGSRDVIGHPFVDAEHQRLHRPLGVRGQRQQQGKEPNEEAVHVAR